MTDLQRVQREQKQRRATFVDWFDMDVLNAITEGNGSPDLVFITGPADNLPDESVLIDDALRAGWEIEPPYINKAVNPGEQRLSVRYVKRTGQRETNRKRVEVRAAAEWIGPDLHAALAFRAWDRLRQDLRAAFGPQTVLLNSPAQTGQDLLERALPRQKQPDGTLKPYTFEPVPESVATLLYDCMGQGRLETDTFYRERRIERLYGLDGVWMYAACLSNLPNGPLTVDTKDTPPGWANGFLVASVRVPDEWAHIGLLPEPYQGDDGQTHRRYPRTPGQWFSSTMTTAEYALAVARGWDVRIKRRILWPAPKCDPARQWNEKLQSLRGRYAIQAQRGDIVAAALAGTIRRLMLHTIGLWFSHSPTSDGYVKREDVPQLMRDHPDARLTVHGRHWFFVEIPRAPEPEAWKRPEWAAQVWGKCRYKLAAAALDAPFDSLVSLRTDAIWLDQEPLWTDWTEVGAGKPGTFRLKEIIEGPLSAPRNEADMRALLPHARRV